MDSFLAFANGGKHPKWPQEIFLDITRTCNLKCIMCRTYSAGTKHIPKKMRSFVSPDAFESSLKSLLPYALMVHPYVFGEPTTHPQLRSYVDWLSRYEVLIHFVTNGMKLDASFCDFLVARSVFAVTVSFSGVTSTDYEQIYVGAKFNQVLEGISRLTKAKQRQHSPYPLVFINSIAFRSHLDKLVEFVELMAGYGVNKIFLTSLAGFRGFPQLNEKITVFRPWREGQILDAAKKRAFELGVELDTTQFERSKVENENEVSKVHQAMILPPPIDEKDDLPSTSKFTPPCCEPYVTLFCLRDLEVKPCCLTVPSVSFGNLKAQSAESIWNSPRWKTLSRNILTDAPRSICNNCFGISCRPFNHRLKEKYRYYSEWFRYRFGIPFYPEIKPLVDTVPDNQSIAESHKVSSHFTHKLSKISGFPKHLFFVLWNKKAQDWITVIMLHITSPKEAPPWLTKFKPNNQGDRNVRGHS
ncbi:MAG: radical SAM protein [Deltaproteobacteria bacterium]|nr:radical SAM protein [Deltaproteobacteria bacterium]